jgi:ATP synthase F1 complex assembly factor 2
MYVHIYRLEEEFQLEVWGVVEGGHDMDRLNNSVNLSAVSIYRYTDI